MKRLGVKVAMDDFGAGHTSFRNLRGLAFDLVKIDGAFVQNFVSSADDRFFVRTLVDLAHHLALTVVAEWVEDAETAALLRAWGVDYFQGDLFGRAGPENAQAFRARHVTCGDRPGRVGRPLSFAWSARRSACSAPRAAASDRPRRTAAWRSRLRPLRPARSWRRRRRPAERIEHGQRLTEHRHVLARLLLHRDERGRVGSPKGRSRAEANCSRKFCWSPVSLSIENSR